ncbi:TIR domain-containing protein [Actinosynnema sp. NPDC059797]
MIVVDVPVPAERRVWNAFRRDVHELVRSSFEATGLPWDDGLVRDAGDPMLVLVPAHVSKVVVAETWVATLADLLRQHNATRDEGDRIGIRVAIHAGEVRHGALGDTGLELVTAYRLADSTALKAAARTSPHGLVVIVSDWFFDEVIRHTTLIGDFRRVQVQVKAFAANAWVRVVGRPGPEPAEPGARTDFAVVYEARDAEWAESIAALLTGAGYSAELEARFLRTPPTGGVPATFDHVDRLIVVVSPNLPERAASALSRWRDRTTAVEIASGGPVTSFPHRVSVVGTDLSGAGASLLRALGLPGFNPIVHNSAVRHGTVFSSGPVLQAGRDLVISYRGPDAPNLAIVHAVPDELFAEELASSLRPLAAERALGWITTRAVSEANLDLEGHADPRVRDADLILVVISRDLLAVQYGASREFRAVVNRSVLNRAAVVMPVVYRPAAWEEQFGFLPPLPTGGLPVVDWPRRDDALLSVVEGVRFACEQLRGGPPKPTGAGRAPVRRRLSEVFTETGVPTVTFVEPDEFDEFRERLRQPGLGIVLEGPSGIGKTTMLRRAMDLDPDLAGMTVLSARDPRHLDDIAELPERHEGLVAVDDFQRLRPEVQARLADHLKLLADRGSADERLVLVGIPGTTRSLVSVGRDLATRIRVFRLGTALEALVVRLIEQGEEALNIEFDRKADISRAAAGSLLTAQMLCWQIALTAGVRHTEPTRRVVRTELAHARSKVTERLKLKYHDVVLDFITRDRADEAVCVDLLLELAAARDGILRLDGRSAELFEGHHDDHLFHDPRSRRLVVDDPQFLFYLRQLRRDELLDLAGKRLPAPRDQVFVCYSHRDTRWLQRLQVHLRPLELDLWSDRRIELGDRWQREITKALARAKAALVLVSADSLASDYINSVELPALLAAAETDGCRIVPVLVGPSMFHRTPALSRFQGVPAAGTLDELPAPEAERVLAELAGALAELFT